MKRLFIILIVLLVFSSSGFTADTVTPSRSSETSYIVTIKLSLVAAADGTLTPVQIEAADVSGIEYWKRSLYLLDAYAINDATTYPAAGAITITDEVGKQLIGSIVGDTLTFATTASGKATLSATRGSGSRLVKKRLTISSTTMTTNGAKVDVYLDLGR